MPTDLPHHAPHGPPGPVELKGPEGYRTLLDKYNTLLFDCDGVIWSGPAGDQLTPNIAQTLSYFRSLNKRLAFITNNATKSRQSYVDKFKGFGIEVSLDEMFTCGSALASYLKEVVLPGIEDESKRGIYMIGQKALEEEFAEEGLTWKGGTVRLQALALFLLAGLTPDRCRTPRTMSSSPIKTSAPSPPTPASALLRTRSKCR